MRSDTLASENVIPSFAIHTLGCKVNTYESDLISERMRSAGFTEVDFKDRADVYIINTCTVTNIADRKSRQMLHRARKRNEKALIVAAGCYADAVEQEKGLREPEVDIWVSNRDKDRIADLCAARLNVSGSNKEDGTDGQSGAPFLTRLDGHTRAFVKIEDGCGMFCSYCIIPYVRGKVRSRPAEDTAREVKALSENGVTEIVLTGIHISSMGVRLLETIEAVNAIPGVRRIRLGSLEPGIITGNFVERLKKSEKVCPHFHLSLQSGCDGVLRRMRRRYTAEGFLKSCEILRDAYPGAAVTTDIIAGFPGETEAEFEETLSFMRKAGFYEAHIFRYSRRKGTEAAMMKGQLTEAQKASRSDRLVALSEVLSHEYRAGFIGREVSFLKEEQIEAEGVKYDVGYTKEYVRCAACCRAGFSPGEIVSGKAAALKTDPVHGEYLLLS